MTTLQCLPEAEFADALGLVHTLKIQAVRENKRKNLELLWRVLEGMWCEGSRDYGVAEVGRRLAEAGGPKTQSLRNEGGQDFRRVIEAFAVCAGARGRVQMVQGRSQLDIAVEALPDPAVRAIFRQVVAENKLYKSQNDQLRSAFKKLSVRRPANVQLEQPVEGAVQNQVTENSVLTQGERDLLRKNIAPSRFEENGWTILGNGGVLDSDGVMVLSPGFVAVVNRLAGK
ncbi:gamma-mobile-trio protein GmtX [Chromobacterium haemolyticum]|uniref:gamma-mobile-trio protein GmtX n=1 Tax=Chromobacterium haemolyticum TaxID=394935 RepID=UPI0006944368|nr:gamma-mobile-trio protein GmtX [Chromobacterium haemolyticum]